MDRSPRTLGRLASAAAATLVLTAAACSFVDSSKSISTSIGSSFESSSSSSPADSESAYRDDVRDYAYSQSRASRDGATILRGIPAIAGRHGISNWEASPATWSAIGWGLARASVGAVQLEQYKDELAGTDATRKAQIQSGFDSYPSK